MSKYGHRQLNWFETIVNKIGGEERADAFLRGELSVSAIRSWRDEDGVVYLSVTSNGKTGEYWIRQLESKGIHVGVYSRQVLCSPDFRPTRRVTTEVAILPGLLFDDQSRITSNICAEAERRKLINPSAEVACLIRDGFPNSDLKDMGLEEIVVMHKSIDDSVGEPIFLGVSRAGGSSLEACRDRPGHVWHHGNGFAFAASVSQGDA
jgi:hypothetical protein